MKYKLNYPGPVIVSLDVIAPNSKSVITYKGDQELVDIVKPVLESSYGAFGHKIGSSTTAVDLDAAMMKPDMQQFRPEIIEGQELVNVWDPGIPDGSVT